MQQVVINDQSIQLAIDMKLEMGEVRCGTVDLVAIIDEDNLKDNKKSLIHIFNWMVMR